MCITIPADLGRLAEVRRFVAEKASHYCGDEAYLYELTLIVEEAITNIILHGYQSEHGEITIWVQALQDSTDVIIRDQAPPYDPTCLPPAQLDIPLGRRNLGGLGVHLMRINSDRMSYRRTPEGSNELILGKKYPVGVG